MPKRVFIIPISEWVEDPYSACYDNGWVTFYKDDMRIRVQEMYCIFIEESEKKPINDFLCIYCEERADLFHQKFGRICLKCLALQGDKE